MLPVCEVGPEMRFDKLLRFGLVVLATSALAGCWTPGSGPSTDSVRSSEAGSTESLPYALVKITPEVEAVMASVAPRLSDGDTAGFRAPPNEIRFGIGDVVSVTIFEAAAGGLFIPLEAGVRPGNFVTIPNQNVDNNGFISVPYAGAIRAKGRTPAEVQQAIVD